MTLGQVAAMIAAIAFAVLVGFISMTLLKIGPILTDLKETVAKLNHTIQVVTMDVDHLSHEVEGLLNKTNTLVDDINRKLGKTDPLFDAIGDVGTSVSELNSSTKEMASNFVSSVTTKKRKSSPLQSLIKASKIGSLKVKAPKSSTQVERLSSSKVTERPSLNQFTSVKPSKTAGEITIQMKEDI